MELLKDTPFEVAWLTWQARPHTICLTIVVKGAFRIVESGECGIDPQQELLSGDLHHDDDVARSVRCESDFAPIKPRGECFVVGSCFAPGGRPSEVLLAAFKIGPVVKKMAIIGDRHFHGLLSGQTKPAPFVEMPLCWERAFGGPRSKVNPVGLGLGKSVVDGKAVIRLPNIEDPVHLIEGKRDRPNPIGSFPIPRSWPARTSLCGTYNARWARTRWPWQPADFQVEHHCAAPPDQRIPGFFRGDEEISLVNLHPSIPKARFRLPGLGVRAFLREVEGDVLRPLVPELDTITVDTDLGKVLCLWRAVTEVPTEELEELSHLFVLHEELGANRAEKEYRELFARRLAETAAEESVFEAASVPDDDRARASMPQAPPLTAVPEERPERPSRLSSIPSTLLRKASVLPEPVPLSSPVMTEVTENAFDERSLWIDAILDESKQLAEPPDLPLPVTGGEPARVEEPTAGEEPPLVKENELAEPTMTFEQFLQQRETGDGADEAFPGAEPVKTVVLPVERFRAEETPKEEPPQERSLDKTVCLPSKSDEAPPEKKPQPERPLDNTVCLPSKSDEPPPEKEPEPEQPLDQTVCLPSKSDEPAPAKLSEQESPVAEPTITFDAFTRMQARSADKTPEPPSRALEPLKTMVLPAKGKEREEAPLEKAPPDIPLDQTVRMASPPKMDEPPTSEPPAKVSLAEEDADGPVTSDDDEYASVAFTLQNVDDSARALLAALEARATDDELDVDVSEEADPFEVTAGWVRVSTDEDVDLEGAGEEAGWTVSEESLLMFAQEASFLEELADEATIGEHPPPARIEPRAEKAMEHTDDSPTEVAEPPEIVLEEKPKGRDVESVMFMRSSDLLEALAQGDDATDEEPAEISEGQEPRGKESVVFLRSSELAEALDGQDFEAFFTDEVVDSRVPEAVTPERKALTPAPPAYLGREPTEEEPEAPKKPDEDRSGEEERELADPQRIQRGRVETALADGASLAGWELEGADLSGLDLSGADLRDAILTRADLKSAKLDGARLDGAVLIGADLTGASLRETSFDEACLIEARGSELRFESASLEDVNATDASFPGALFLDSSCSYLELIGADLVGARFERTELDNADMSGSMLDDAVFMECSMKELDLSGGTSAKRVKMDECDLEGLRASNESDLTDGSFVKAKIMGGRFGDSKLDRANFSFSDLENADFSGSTLGKAKLLGCRLRKANFDRAHLTAALLGKSDLHEARFERARLTYTDLRGCNLYGAEFFGAVIDGALLELANLKGTKLA